ncbi:MAG: hypothetical protein ACXADD_17405 [Candidatus Thorarchaeota archaeon]|jgi:hypothetical protein
MKSVQGDSEKILKEPEDGLRKEEKIRSLMSKPRKKYQRCEDRENYPIWVL